MKVKKKQKGLSPYCYLNPNAGDVEKNIEFFNNSVSTDASAVSEEIGKNWSRNQLISELRKYRNYKFDKYTNQQLFVILNRIINDNKKKKEQEETHLEKEKSTYPVYKKDVLLYNNYKGINIYVDKNNTFYTDKYHAFASEEDACEYIDSITEGLSTMNIREQLNKYDRIGIDNDNYLDLLNLYEAVAPKLTSKNKAELKKLVNTAKDPNEIYTYLNTALNNTGNQNNDNFESLNESVSNNLDVINYNDYIANAFDGYTDNIDDEIKLLNRYARALHTRADKMFAIMLKGDDVYEYAPEFIDEDKFEDINLVDIVAPGSLYSIDITTPPRSINMIQDHVNYNEENLWFKNEADANAYLKFLDYWF